MVFFTTRKQVRFVYEMFKKMQPGCPIQHIHGKMVQAKRMATFYDFTERTGGCVLLSTQVAARGLDFPDVNWVVLFDCPSDVQSYVHTVGRTARNFANGNSLLMLLPSEKKFLERLQSKKLAPKKIIIKSDKLRNIDGTLTSFVAENRDIKYLGERAFVSYVRSLFLEKDKEVFQPEKIDFVALTKAMGLPGTPKIEGKNIGSKNRLKNMPYALQELLGLAKTKKQEEKTYVEKLISKKNVGVYSEKNKNMRELAEDDEDEDDAFFTVVEGDKQEFKAEIDHKKEEEEFLESSEDEDKGTNFVEELQELVKKADPKDKTDDRERVREIHQLDRWKAKHERRVATQAQQKAGGAYLTTLQTIEEDSDSNSDSDSSDSNQQETKTKQKMESSDESSSSSDEETDEQSANITSEKTMDLEQAALSLLGN